MTITTTATSTTTIITAIINTTTITITTTTTITKTITTTTTNNNYFPPPSLPSPPPPCLSHHFHHFHRCSPSLAEPRSEAAALFSHGVSLLPGAHRGGAFSRLKHVSVPDLPRHHRYPRRWRGRPSTLLPRQPTARPHATTAQGHHSPMLHPCQSSMTLGWC